VTSSINAPLGNSAKRAPTTRILCLGNDILADDALGFLVADYLRESASPEIDIVSSAESGFHLLDHILDVHTLVVIDTVKTGLAPPGTIYQLRPDEMQVVIGGSPHYIGLSETLALARRLNLPVANNVLILAVECSDCLAVGGEMSPAVRAAIPPLLGELRRLLATNCVSRPPPVSELKTCPCHKSFAIRAIGVRPT
jgi:hydrogenase maturation protease